MVVKDEISVMTWEVRMMFDGEDYWMKVVRSEVSQEAREGVEHKGGNPLMVRLHAVGIIFREATQHLHHLLDLAARQASGPPLSKDEEWG